MMISRREKIKTYKLGQSLAKIKMTGAVLRRGAVRVTIEMRHSPDGDQ